MVLRARDRQFSRRSAVLGLASAAAAPALAARPAPQLAFLSAGKVLAMGLDGRGLRTVATSAEGGPRGFNDGVAYDAASGRLYWTNMGRPNADDGYIQSVRLDGSDLRTIVPPGGTFTPKQLKLAAGKLYWSDREGMRVMRANLDGSAIEVLVQTGSGDADREDASRWCVGVAVDPARGHVYWTQKGGTNAGQGSIRRAPIAIPPGHSAADRKDIEVLFANLPEPIDLELDLPARRLYWTDRGDNTVSAAGMDPPDDGPTGRLDRQVLIGGLREAIGIAHDPVSKRLFYTSLGGEVGTLATNGTGARTLHQAQEAFSGIVVVR